MANKIYNQKVVASRTANIVNQEQGIFTYKGFSSKEVTRNYKLYDIDLVKQDLINHFYIRKGEKLENPEFGTIIWDMLFEPLTEQAKQLITTDVTEIVNADPRVQVTQSIVTQLEYGIQIEVSLTYLPYNIQETLQFEFDRRNNIF